MRPVVTDFSQRKAGSIWIPTVRASKTDDLLPSSEWSETGRRNNLKQPPKEVSDSSGNNIAGLTWPGCFASRHRRCLLPGRWTVQETTHGVRYASPW